MQYTTAYAFIPSYQKCAPGSTYNLNTHTCIKKTVCPSGFSKNLQTGQCTKIESCGPGSTSNLLTGQCTKNPVCSYSEYAYDTVTNKCVESPSS